MKKVLFVYLLAAVLVLGSLTGCGKQPSVCTALSPADSYICQVIPNPESVDVILQLANMEAIKYNAYTAEQAETFVREVMDFVETVETYHDMVQWVTAKLDNVPVEIIVLSQWSARLDAKIAITDLDRKYLMYHLNNQLAIISVLRTRNLNF